MSDISATDASRKFADLLDAVEYQHESFTIIRRGRVVARLGPAEGADGAAIKALVRKHRPDPTWADDLAELRGSLVVEERSWPA